MDAHCHLSDETFDDKRPELYRELLEDNIVGLVLAGTEPSDWQRQADLSQNLPPPLRTARVFGLHPWWVDSFSEMELQSALAALEDRLKLSHCEGIGELGLDYFRAKDEPAREKQRRWFTAQLKLAKAFHDLPLILHVVRAHHEAIPLLKKERRTFRGLVHAYWANLETAKAYIDLGFLLSLPPRILKEDPHRLLQEIDPEKIVFETDTPFFDAEKRLVRPKFIREILEFSAKARKESLVEAVNRQERLLIQLFPILGDES